MVGEPALVLAGVARGVDNEESVSEINDRRGLLQAQDDISNDESQRSPLVKFPGVYSNYMSV